MMPKVFSFFKKQYDKLGPGFITGAADDDPSGVATYSIAGAQFGYKLSWLSLFLIPMMISIQEMCARVGMCSGMGLAGVIKKYHSKKLLYFAVSLLIIANVINITADLSIMAASLQMVLGMPYLYWLAVITVVSVGLEVFISYKNYSQFLKWTGMSLLVYAVTAFLVKQDWVSVARYTFIPHIEFTLPFLMAIVGFIGTTISPYLFFWQADEEIEEEIQHGEIKDFASKVHLKKKSLIIMQNDTALGMIFSNIISFFIVLTTAGTLYASGLTNIETPQQVALALKPLAGNFAYLLFTFGIIGIGLQSVPVFAGGIAYAVSETFGWKEGLGKKLRDAKAFYLIIALATVLGAVLNVTGINPIKALYYAAIINGVISVPLIAIIIRLAADKRVVGEHKTSRIHTITGWVTFLFVATASVLMIWNMIFPK
jgi:NRAMP (natural resistance-associated macrophage protein)-like metal ion transporter